MVLVLRIVTLPLEPLPKVAEDSEPPPDINRLLPANIQLSICLENNPTRIEQKQISATIHKFGKHYRQ